MERAGFNLLPPPSLYYLRYQAIDHKLPPITYAPFGQAVAKYNKNSTVKFGNKRCMSQQVGLRLVCCPVLLAGNLKIPLKYDLQRSKHEPGVNSVAACRNIQQSF